MIKTSFRLFLHLFVGVLLFVHKFTRLFGLILFMSLFSVGCFNPVSVSPLNGLKISSYMFIYFYFICCSKVAIYISSISQYFQVTSNVSFVNLTLLIFSTFSCWVQFGFFTAIWEIHRVQNMELTPGQFCAIVFRNLWRRESINLIFYTAMKRHPPALI